MEINLATAVVAAIVAAAASILATIVTNLVNLGNSRRTFKLEHKAEKVVKLLLSKPHPLCRSFSDLCHHIGGFEENELRRLLVRSGAIRFMDEEKSSERWALLDNCGDDLVAPELE